MTSRSSLIFLILAVANASSKSIIFKPSTNISTDEYLDGNENLSSDAYKVIVSRSSEFPYVKNSSDRSQLSKSIDPEPSADIFAKHLDNNDNNNKNLSPDAYKVITIKTSYPEVIEEIIEEIQEIHTHRIIKTIRHRSNRNKSSSIKSDKKKTVHDDSPHGFLTSPIDKDNIKTIKSFWSSEPPLMFYFFNGSATNATNQDTNETKSSIEISATTTPPFVNFMNETSATTPTNASDQDTESSIHEVTKFSGDNYAINKTQHEITNAMLKFDNGTMVKMIFEEPTETSMTEASKTTNPSVSSETSTSESLIRTNSSASSKISTIDASTQTNSSDSLETSTSGSLTRTNSSASLKTSMTDASTQTNSSDSLESSTSGPSVSSVTPMIGLSKTTNSSVSSETSWPESLTITNSSASSGTLMTEPSTMAESSISSETPKLLLSKNSTPILLEISKPVPSTISIPVPSTTTRSPKPPATENSSWMQWWTNKFG